MRKIAMSLVAASILASVTMVGNAEANNNNNGWYALGGVVGGLVLGNVLQNNRPYPAYPAYPAYPTYPAYPAYVEQPAYEKQCYARWVRVWDEYRNTWIKVRRTKCEWVPAY